jgi:hypothetical protein
LLLITAAAPVSTQIVPQMPDPCLSFVSTSGADIFLDGSGETLADLGAQVTVSVRDGEGAPISNIPADLIFLVNCDENGNFVADPPLYADGPTDANGITTISGALCGRGWSDGLSVVAIGVVLRCSMTEVPCQSIRVRSTDINADGVLDHLDVNKLFTHYPPGSYHTSVDFNFDGIINLSDFTTFGAQWGPVPGVSETCQ